MRKMANFDSIKRIFPREGVNRRAFSGEDCMLVVNEIESFAQPALHSHPQEQLTYILEGECTFILGEESIHMGAGDVILVPPNVPHTLRPIGKKTIVNIDVFSPIRQDYLV
jgi:quercetin dioxygenase-like cupin family protein